MNTFMHMRIDPKANISITHESAGRVAINIKNSDSSEVIKLEMTIGQLMSLEDFFTPIKVF